MEKKYIAFYKPYMVLCQFTKELAEDRTLADFNLPPNIYSAGRLDKDSEGLLVLSNDGDFIHRASSPHFEKVKTYWAQVEGIPTFESLEKLKNGLKIQDYVTKKCETMLLDNVEVDERQPPIRYRASIPTSWIEIKISEGKNRQVRKMTAAIGHPTLRLIRVGLGKLKLGDMKPGEWRFVNQSEVL